MASKQSGIATVDFFVPHVSRVRANAGQLVGLHVHQRIAKGAKQGPGKGRVVLFVHGGHSPVVPTFDLDYKDYSWMAFLARAGFNCYGMDLSGYGSSPRPMMDDPTNVCAETQAALVPYQLKAPCAPNYPYQSHTIRSDWAEMDTVVDYLRRVNRVRKVSLIGWSAGGPRTGGYASLHPDKVDRLVLYAPGEPKASLDKIPDQPAPGAPTDVQTREHQKKRWDSHVVRTGQVAADIRDVIGKALSRWDVIGASWGPPGGVTRAPVRTRFGWTRAMAARIKAPALLIVGDQDRPEERRLTYDLLTIRNKAFVLVESASHFMVWEKQRRVLHERSLEWLAQGRVNGKSSGWFKVDWNGRYSQG